MNNQVTIMSVVETDLKAIADHLVVYLEHHNEMLRYTDYHGFQKSRLADEKLVELLTPFSFTPEQIQIEIVQVNSNLRDQVHYHKDSFAYIYILGQQQGFPTAHKAFSYQNHKWVEAKEYTNQLIKPNTPHGFTIDNGGTLYFLSVQTPPIVNHNKDDYHLYNT